MVWAGRWSTKSAWAAARPSGWAVIRRIVAPAAFATPISASAVEISPGPQVTRNRSFDPTGGVVMSPSTASPMWNSRMAKPMICSFSRPPPEDDDPPCGGDPLHGAVDVGVVQAVEDARELVQGGPVQLA